MPHSKSHPEPARTDITPPAAWRQVIDSVFGAAARLHRYRDTRDVLLRQVLIEQEQRLRQQGCCDE